ncbi:MAG: hypothetical protein V1899_03590 [Planctomycetota bacterium]
MAELKAMKMIAQEHISHITETIVRTYLPDKVIIFYTHEEVEKWKDVRLSFVATVLREGNGITTRSVGESVEGKKMDAGDYSAASSQRPSVAVA